MRLDKTNYKVIGKLAFVRNLSNRIIVLQDKMQDKR